MQIPVLRFLEDDPDATAIFVYPTKVGCRLSRGLVLWNCNLSLFSRLWLKTRGQRSSNYCGHVPDLNISRSQRTTETPHKKKGQVNGYFVVQQTVTE
jgi:hypothetical protein